VCRADLKKSKSLKITLKELKKLRNVREILMLGPTGKNLGWGEKGQLYLDRKARKAKPLARGPKGTRLDSGGRPAEKKTGQEGAEGQERPEEEKRNFRRRLESNIFERKGIRGTRTGKFDRRRRFNGTKRKKESVKKKSTMKSQNSVRGDKVSPPLSRKRGRRESSGE